MKKQILNVFVAVVFGLIISSGFCVLAQSTDGDHPTPITSNVLTGTVRGQGEYWFSLRARRGSTVTVTAILNEPEGGSFSLSFHGRAGADGGETACCEGDSYMPYDYGAEVVNEKLVRTFRVTTSDTFLMALSVNSPQLTYKITFEGFDFGDKPNGNKIGKGDGDSESKKTITVDGKTGNNWVDTGIDIKKGDKIILSATGKVDVSAGWGIHDARGTKEFADVPGYPIMSPRRYGLAAKVGLQKWAYEGGAMVAARNGRLYLTCNDDNPDDNEGEFVVTVQIIRKK